MDWLVGEVYWEWLTWFALPHGNLMQPCLSSKKRERAVWVNCLRGCWNGAAGDETGHLLAVPFFSLRSLRYKNILMESEKTEKYDRKQRSWRLEVRTISGDMICWQGSCTIQTKSSCIACARGKLSLRSGWLRGQIWGSMATKLTQNEGLNCFPIDVKTRV